MTDGVRLDVPAFYRAGVVPRGARLPKMHVFRLTVPVDVEVVRSGDLEAAARASAPKLESSYEYLARGSRLSAVCRAGWSPSSPPLPAGVEDLRLLVREACGRLEADELDAWARKVEPFYGAALVRWDEYELPRVAAQAPAPDLEAPPGDAP